MEIWAYGFVIILYIQIVTIGTSTADVNNVTTATSMSPTTGPAATDSATETTTSATTVLPTTLPPTTVTPTTLPPTTVTPTTLPPTTTTPEPVATRGEHCNSSLNCDPTANLECNNLTSTCVCPVSHYWNNSACVSAAIFNQPCNINIPESCKQHVNLTCDKTSSLCNCSTSNFWNQSACVSVDELAPGNPTFTDIGPYFINVSWSRPNVAQSVRLEYIVVWSSQQMDNGSMTTAETEISIPVRQSGDIYTIEITAISLVDQKNASVTRTQRTIPLKPTNISLSSLAAPNISVMWMHTGVIAGFNGSLTSDRDTWTFNKTKNSTEFGGLKAGTNYTFSITAFSGVDRNNGDSTQYSMVSVFKFTTNTSEPGPPTFKRVEFKNMTSLSIKLEDPQEPNGVITGYLFEITSRKYPDEPFGNKTFEFPTLTTNRIFVFSPLEPGIEYNFTVLTQNNDFNGTDPLSFTLETDEDVPGEVVIKNPQNTTTSDMVTLMWSRPIQPNGDIIGYRILVNDTESMNDCFETILMCRTQNCTHPQMTLSGKCKNVSGLPTFDKNEIQTILTVTKLTANKNYSVVITAFTGAGEGSPASDIFMTIIAVPDRVTDVMGTVKNSTSIEVTWTIPVKNPGPTTYIITTHDMINKTNNIKGQPIEGFETRNQVIGSLMEYWPYQFTVQICTDKGCRNERTTENTTTLSARPGNLQAVEVNYFNLDVDDCHDTKIQIVFTEPSLEDRNSRIKQYLVYDENSSQNKLLTKIKSKLYDDPYSLTSEKIKLTVPSLSPDYNYKLQIKAETEGSKVYVVHDFATSILIEKCGLTTLQTVLVVIFVLLAIGVIAGTVYICYVKRRKLNKMISGFRKMRKGDPSGFIGPGDVEEPEDIQEERPFVLSDIHEIVEEKHKNDNLEFRKEYDELKIVSPKYSFDAANIDENKSKNRYYNILPFDHSRVKLIPVDDDPSSDYINANYIPGYNSEREFIAAQGPLPGTAADFWRMVWEQNVGVIVMLTKCQENHQEKCFQYWPDEVNEPRQHGDIVVNPISVSNIDKYNITVFNVSLGDHTRTIKHFHFLEWPDFSAKVEPNDMIDFVSLVRGHITPDIKGPAIIHCSAGVGRTGTYISVDYLIQCVRDMALDEEVDIFAWVLQMRNYRTNMVQVMNQYSFIHDALKVLVERKERMMQEDEEDGLLYMNQTYENKAFDESEDLYENTKHGDQPLTEL